MAEILKKEDLEDIEKSDLSAYLAGLELKKIESSKELAMVTGEHNKIVKAISEVKAELMLRNSRYVQKKL